MKECALKIGNGVSTWQSHSSETTAINSLSCVLLELFLCIQMEIFKRDMPANSHASLRYGCHASSQPLFLISSLLQITKLLAPSLHADLN